eukprot:Gb_26332 [translate_table: standard]
MVRSPRKVQWLICRFFEKQGGSGGASHMWKIFVWTEQSLSYSLDDVQGKLYTMSQQSKSQYSLWSLQNVPCMEESNSRPQKNRRMAGVLTDGGKHAAWLQEVMGRFHCHAVKPSEWSSVIIERIEAPVTLVWSLLRRFDKPQSYKRFVRTCNLAETQLKEGSVREVRVVSGLPAATSTERLEILDDERHIMSFRIVGGDHRLNNYRSITTLHETVIKGKAATIAIESYVVEVPEGNTKEDTCLFIDTIVKCNLHSLAQISHTPPTFNMFNPSTHPLY